MNEITCNILEEYHMNSLIPKATLVELKLDYSGNVMDFGAIQIDNEVFLFDGFYYSHNGWIQIDIKDSSQTTFMGKQLVFIKKGDERIKNAIRMYDHVHIRFDD